MAPVSNLRPAPYRTETMVEKLLTNWLSICLYTFLRVRGALDGTFCPCSNEGLLPVASLTCTQIPPGASGCEGTTLGDGRKGKGFELFSPGLDVRQKPAVIAHPHSVQLADPPHPHQACTARQRPGQC